MSLFNILVDIAARTANFESGMQRVEKRLESFGANTRKLAQTAGGLIGVTLGFDAIRQSIDRAIARGDQLDRLAERMDTTAKSLSQLEYAAKKSDMEFGSLAGMIDTFTKNVGMAAVGTGRAQKPLKELGISAKELAALGLDEQLDLIADAIARISNTTRQQTITSQLFGSADMLSVLKNGAAGLRELREESDRLGFSLENEAAEKLAKADDAMKALNVATTALSTTLAVSLAPALTQVINGFNAFASNDFTKNLRAQMADLTERRNELLKQQRNIQTSWLSKFLLGDNIDAALASVRKNIAGVEAEMNRINGLMLKGESAAAKASKEASGKDQSGWVDLSGVDRRLNTMSELADNVKWLEEIDAYQDGWRTALAELNDDVAATTARNFEAIANENERALSDLGESLESHTNEWSTYADQAARNMQSHFADFLFDPFDKGLKGMAKGFIDVLRRMLAEAASAKIFDTLFGKSGGGGGGSLGSGIVQGEHDWLNSILSGVFGGGKAKGGPLQQGKWYVAGEHGPEPIWGGGPGAYAMGYGGGGGNVTLAPVYNIDARGASMEFTKVLPEILKRNNQQLESTIVTKIKRRQYNLG